MFYCTFLPAPARSRSRMRGKQSWLMGRRRFRWWHTAFLLCAFGFCNSWACSKRILPHMRPGTRLVEGWLRSCKMRVYRVGPKDLFDSLQTHAFLSVENCFGKCIDALAISCPTLNVTFSPGHDVALAKQRYRALQVEVIAAKNPCCSFWRRPDWQGSPLGRVKCIKNRPKPFPKESVSKFQMQRSSKVHEPGPLSRCAAFVLYCKTNEDPDVSSAETAADSSTPHRSDTDLQGWSEALHSIAIAKCGTALVNCAWTFLR